jgi:hypothetical protein
MVEGEYFFPDRSGRLVFIFVRGNAKLFGILLEQGYCDIKVAKTFHLKKGKMEALGK